MNKGISLIQELLAKKKGISVWSKPVENISPSETLVIQQHRDFIEQKKEKVSSTKIIRSKERIKQTGEVFTPIKLVDEILSKLPVELFKDPKKTFLDPACGDGNFLVRVIAFKIEHGSSVMEALETTYGVDIMEDNVEACRERLIALADDYDKEVFGYQAAEEKYGEVIRKNIIHGDTLKFDI